MIVGDDGDNVITGGRGQDDLTGGGGADIFVYDDRDTGDATFGQADTIADFGVDDVIDLMATEVRFFAGLDVVEPPRGGFSLWQADGNTYVTWKTFGSYHDIELTGYTGDLVSLYRQIRWYDDDHLSGIGTASMIAAGGTVSGVIENWADEDWFRIEVEAGNVYTFTLSTTGATPLDDPFFGLFDAEGAFVSEGFDEITLVADSDATYFVSTATYGFGGGDYEITAAAAPYSDDFAASTSTTGVLADGGSATGSIELLTDADWFRIELQAGRAYTFTVVGTDGDGGTLDFGGVGLFDADGAWVGYGSDTMTVASPEDGTYFVEVVTLGGTGSYTLEASSVPYVDDVGSDPATAASVAAGETATGTIGVSFDVDWFAIELAAGEAVTIDLRGADSGAGTLSDPYLELLSADGEILAWNDDAIGLDSQIAFEAEAAGTYYISAAGLGSLAGTYELEVTAGLLIAA